MRRGIHALLSALVVLASQAGDASCEQHSPASTRCAKPSASGRGERRGPRTGLSPLFAGPEPSERPFNVRDGDFWGTALDCEEG